MGGPGFVHCMLGVGDGVGGPGFVNCIFGEGLNRNLRGIVPNQCLRGIFPD